MEIILIPPPPPDAWCSGKTNSAVSVPSFAVSGGHQQNSQLGLKRFLEFNLFIKILHARVCFAGRCWRRQRRKQKSAFFIFSYSLWGPAAPGRSITYHRVGKIQENREDSCFMIVISRADWLAKTINKNKMPYTRSRGDHFDFGADRPQVKVQRGTNQHSPARWKRPNFCCAILDQINLHWRKVCLCRTKPKDPFFCLIRKICGWEPLESDLNSIQARGDNIW